MMDIDTERLDEVLSVVRERLLGMRVDGGHWEGRLSSSALATATAVGGLCLAGDEGHKELVEGGLKWLCESVNDDGGWGDTDVSESNISTTLLCWAAFGMAGADERYAEVVKGAQRWIEREAGGLEPNVIASAIYEKYGDDRTFAVPILTMCALAGRLGDDPWDMIEPLPFELAVFPHCLYKWLNLSVVSYALAALIAIGQVHFHHLKPGNVFTRFMRKICRGRTLKKLADIQPKNGGYLEAVPLTSFVVMSLGAGGNRGHVVAEKGVGFIVSSVREDGSWPIDTNLATWVSTLSVNALAGSEGFEDLLDEEARKGLLEWLMGQQYKRVHPYVNAEPGGWAWTDRPGGVPDADDTAGAILALRNLGGGDEDVKAAALKGIEWLMDIQNKDGGMPTFCRGWQDLPFDRSSPDLSAHAVAAMAAWIDEVDQGFAEKMRGSLKRLMEFLKGAHEGDGSWVPLWFGNEKAADQHNRVYGTARVLIGLSCLNEDTLSEYLPMVNDAAGFLVKIQNDNGGWGGDAGVGSSIEETSLAADSLGALLCNDYLRSQRQFENERIEAAVEGGVQWLIERFSGVDEIRPSPIGLYFASLWYYEDSYPWVFAVSAMQRVAQFNGTGL